MSRTTHSLVTFSLENLFPARKSRWLILQRGPSLGLASLPRPTEGTPASFLAQLKALQRVCWMGYAKKNFFRNFLNRVIRKNIALKKLQIFLHFHEKDSHFSDNNLFAPKNTWPKSVPVSFKFDMYTAGLRGIRTWEIYFVAENSTTEPQWLLCLVQLLHYISSSQLKCSKSDVGSNLRATNTFFFEIF